MRNTGTFVLRRLNFLPYDTDSILIDLSSNHLILKHGISPRYLQPFLAPLEIRNSTARIPIRFQDGMCFKCDSWIPKVIEVELGGFKNMEMWWKHAAGE